MSFAGSAGLDNHKINRIIGVPHPLELPFAIYGGSIFTYFQLEDDN